MKTFTAKQLRHNTKEVFEAIDKDGAVIIDHKHYKGRQFILSELNSYDGLQRIHNYKMSEMMENTATKGDKDNERD